jgi:predicted transcriptional regulator of viral defense system
MHFRDTLDELSRANKKVFTTYDAAKFMGKPIEYASLMLSKSRDVVRIEKGVYAIKGTDIYEAASNIVFPSYVSLLAGMQYYGLIDQNIIRYSVITLERHKNITLGKNEIEFRKVKRRLMFGYVSKSGTYIAEPEKLFIDCLYFNIRLHVLLEAMKTAKEENMVSAEKLEEYAIRAGRKTLVNRLGFIMESAGLATGKLEDHIYKNYVYAKANGKKVNKKWRVLYD